MSGRKRSRAADKNGRFPHVLVWGGVLVVGVVVGLLAFHALTPVDDGRLVAVDSIEHEHPGNHVHGLGFDEEGDRLYVATHFGLFVLGDATGPADRLFQVGDLRDDLMGFSLDPHDGGRMFASGHPFERSPSEAPNTGLVRSTDGGFEWEPVWDGPGGQPVDFHAMALSPMDPQRLVGFFGGQLHVTVDEGDSWDAVPSQGGRVCWGAPCLSWDAQEADRLWLGRDEGLFTSPDRGETWDEVRNGTHGAVYAHPADARVWAWSVEEGMIVSEDQGESWQETDEAFRGSGADVFAISGGPDDADVLFAAMLDGEIHRTLDGGETWQRVHPLD